MARVEVIKEFLSADECAQLNTWTLTGVKEKWLDFGFDERNKKYESRLTTRVYGDRFETPAVAHNIFARIRDFLNLQNASVIDGHGKDGIVVSYILPGGVVHPHRDPRIPVLNGLRCNIITQMPDDGGKLWVDDRRIDVGMGDLHCYLVTEHTHYVTEVKGNTPRILWMFGFCIPANDWESGKIKVGEFA